MGPQVGKQPVSIRFWSKPTIVLGIFKLRLLNHWWGSGRRSESAQNRSRELLWLLYLWGGFSTKGMRFKGYFLVDFGQSFPLKKHQKYINWLCLLAWLEKASQKTSKSTKFRTLDSSQSWYLPDSDLIFLLWLLSTIIYHWVVK